MNWSAITLAVLTGGLMVPATDSSAAAIPAAADDDRVLTFRDPRITESSGLVDLGSSMVTANDSGNPSQLFVVSSATGRTVGLVDVQVDNVDVEALAPGGGKWVWVGDIGDNLAEREAISVYRVPVDTGPSDVRPTKYLLVYPRGAHNAESLFTDREGRLHVITQSMLGGTVYRAPLELKPTKPNLLQPEGRVLEYATDAAMLPGGRHVLVRGPGSASIYALPGFRRVGSFALPGQRQGEGVSVGPGGRIRLSSEGVRSKVLQVALPAAVAQRLRPATGGVGPAPGRATGSASGPDDALTGEDRWLRWTIPGIIVLGAIGIGLRLRRRA